MNIALIPARGGSKRITKKNIRFFSGQPIIAWSINAAKKSNCFERIIVSTDDTDIAEIAEKYGAEVPFVRPEKISDDYSTTRDVILHAINFLSSKNINIDYLCCLYATAPFVRSEDLLKAYELLLSSKEGTYTFTATSFSFPIQRAISIDGKGYAKLINPEFYNTRSQDLEEAFHDAGQFYWASRNTWETNSNIFQGSKPLILPRWRVQDIDTEEDWEMAELMHKINLEK